MDLLYHQTRCFLSPAGLVYVFRKPNTTGGMQMLSKRLSDGIETGFETANVLYSTLPFSAEQDSHPLHIMMDSASKIRAIVGSCSDAATRPEIWTFTPNHNDSTGNGTWSSASISSNSTDGAGASHTLTYLSASMVFDSTSDPGSEEFYLFGGMCPNKLAEAAQSPNNTYFNDLMHVSRGGMDHADDGFMADFVSTHSSPIAQSGSSATPLRPSYMNSSSNVQIMQQDFLLLAGNTESAFMSMSRAAILSLPQKSWSFVDLIQPGKPESNDRPLAEAMHLDSRSGHTAVLSDDGRKIILFGGWVGNITTAAQPQLVTLRVGKEYGGVDEWSWTKPDPSTASTTNGTSLYGHGALVLPGGIMMLTGGYTILQDSNSLMKREDVQSNSKNYFYNITSGVWIDSYKLASAEGSAKQDQGSEPFPKSSHKTALGVGLGLGILALITLLCFYIWYTRRLRRLRTLQQRQLLGYNSGDETIASEKTFEKVSYYKDLDTIRQSSLKRNEQPFSQANDEYKPGINQEVESIKLLETEPYYEKDGSLVPRTDHPLSQQNSTAALSSNKGNIHSIHEEDESMASVDMRVNPRSLHFNSLYDLKAKDPLHMTRARALHPLASHPVTNERHARDSKLNSTLRDAKPIASERSHTRRKGEILSCDYAFGRTSPTKSDRSQSILSECSTRSNWSHFQVTRNDKAGPSGFRCTLSDKSAAMKSFKAYHGPARIQSTDGAEDEAMQAAAGDASYKDYNSTSSRLSSTIHENDGDSFATAKSSLVQMLAERESLLGKRIPRRGSRASYDPSKMASNDPEYLKYRSGWLGSVKKALSRTLSGTGANMTERHSSAGQHTNAFQAAAGRQDGLTPTLESNLQALPKRSASDGGFWRARRGARDWMCDGDILPGRLSMNQDESWISPAQTTDESAVNLTGRPRGMDGLNTGTNEDDDEDWDVEAAAEQRVVQVSFTVPKTRLRVVNVDPDRRSVVSTEMDEKQT